MRSYPDVLSIIGLLKVLIHSIDDTAGLRIVSTLIRKLAFPYQCSGMTFFSQQAFCLPILFCYTNDDLIHGSGTEVPTVTRFQESEHGPGAIESLQYHG
jgi:hypothetical protein